ASPKPVTPEISRAIESLIRETRSTSASHQTMGEEGALFLDSGWEADIGPRPDGSFVVIPEEELVALPPAWQLSALISELGGIPTSRSSCPTDQGTQETACRARGKGGSRRVRWFAPPAVASAGSTPGFPSAEKSPGPEVPAALRLARRARVAEEM